MKHNVHIKSECLYCGKVSEWDEEMDEEEIQDLVMTVGICHDCIEKMKNDGMSDEDIQNDSLEKVKKLIDTQLEKEKSIIH